MIKYTAVVKATLGQKTSGSGTFSFYIKFIPETLQAG